MKNFSINVSLIVLLTAHVTHAQTFAIDWHTIDGGGGTSGGGAYSISGTIGQPDPGKLWGGNYTLEGGFWGAAMAVQIEGSPLLTIRPVASNSVSVSWPSPSTGFVLQRNDDLTTTNWLNVTISPIDNGITRSVTVPMSIGNQFFRLVK
jgi:hypothetical protein